MEQTILEVTIIPVKRLYYMDTFGVYGCETNDERIKLNKYGNFVVSGNMTELTLGMDYKAKLTKSKNKKYPDGYDVIQIIQEKPKSIHEQQMYIRTMIKEEHAEAIISKYPNHNLIEMFEKDEVEYEGIRGIGKATYLKIKNALLNNLQISAALVELTPLGVTYKMLHKMIGHYGDVDILMQEVSRNIYTLTQVSGLSFKKVDEYAMKRGDEPHSNNRIRACLFYLLNQEANNGHSWVYIHDIVHKASDTLHIETDYIDGYIDDEYAKYQDPEFKFEPAFFLDSNRIASYFNYKYEKNIAEQMYRLLHTKGNYVFVDEQVEERIKQVEEEQGFSFTDEQREAIYLATQSNVLVINGKAGTGKSSVIKGILRVLSDYTYETCALSGKASLRIIETGLSSRTIHRLLEFNPGQGFTYNEKCPLTQDVIVLDEAGMVGSALFYDLASAVKKGTKFIICGDSAQLPPIGASHIFDDLLNDERIPTVTLNKVHRQAEASGILSCANLVREGKSFVKPDVYTKQVYGELQDFHLFPLDAPDWIQENIVKICESYNGNKDELIVITAMKSKGDLATSSLNKLLQPIFNPEPTGEYMKRGDVTFYIGDRVIVQGNDYNKGIFNAQIGKIINIQTITRENPETFKQENVQIMSVKFDGLDKTIEFEKGEEGVLDLAYALTCHRMQGSAFKVVIVALSYGMYYMLSRQWLYTAMTRASKYCIMVAENAAIQHAIRNNESGKRNTFLKELLPQVWVRREGTGDVRSDSKVGD